MNRNTLKLHGNRTRNQFVVASFNAVFQDTRLHDIWWQAHILVDEVNTRYQLEGEMEIKKSELLRVVGKEYHEKSIEGNIFVGASGDEQLKLFRHDFKTRQGRRKAGEVRFLSGYCKDSPSIIPNNIKFPSLEGAKRIDGVTSKNTTACGLHVLAIFFS